MRKLALLSVGLRKMKGIVESFTCAFDLGVYEPGMGQGTDWK
jgi:hypothetical protein